MRSRDRKFYKELLLANNNMLRSKRLGKFISPFVTLVMLLSAVAGIVKAQPKEQEKKPSKLEVGIRPSVTFPFSYAKGYHNWLNDKFRKGDYTFTTPIPDWKDIKAPSSIGLGIEGSLLYKLKESSKSNPRVGVVVGYEGSSSRSNYNESYDIWDKYYKGGSYIPTNFERQEDTSTNTFSLGAIGKVSLTDRLDVSATVGADFHNVEGNVDYTMKRLDIPVTQWRKANYSGSGTGYSFKVGLDYEIWKNFSFGAALGYRGGKVKTKGKEIKTESSNPGMSWTYDYSPEIDLNSTCVEAGVKVKF